MSVSEFSDYHARVSEQMAPKGVKGLGEENDSVVLVKTCVLAERFNTEMHLYLRLVMQNVFLQIRSATGRTIRGCEYRQAPIDIEWNPQGTLGEFALLLEPTEEQRQPIVPEQTPLVQEGPSAIPS